MLGVAHPVSSGGRRLRHLLSIGGTGAHNGLDSFAMRRRMTTVCPQRTAGPDVALLAGKLFDDHGNRMDPDPGEEGAQALALLCIAGGSARRQQQSGFGRPRSGRQYRNSRGGGSR
jgi:hypothetical protein